MKQASKQQPSAFSLLAQLLFDPEDGGNTFLLYAGKLLPHYMVSYSRRHGYHHENLTFHNFHGVCQHTLNRREKGWATLMSSTQSVFNTNNKALIHVRNQKTVFQQKTVPLTQTVLCQLEPNPQAVSESESNTASAELVLGSLGGVLGVLWLMAKSCARFDLLFLIGANFGGGIMCLSTCWMLSAEPQVLCSLSLLCPTPRKLLNASVVLLTLTFKEPILKNPKSFSACFFLALIS